MFRDVLKKEVGLGWNWKDINSSDDVEVKKQSITSRWDSVNEIAEVGVNME